MKKDYISFEKENLEDFIYLPISEQEKIRKLDLTAAERKMLLARARRMKEAQLRFVQQKENS